MDLSRCDMQLTPGRHFTGSTILICGALESEYPLLRNMADRAVVLRIEPPAGVSLLSGFHRSLAPLG